jgi:NDP-sugar pyrophosphorylase family protein
VTLHLVVMAAGLGSRFGGTKQLVTIGPRGEAFLDYAIADGRAAGVERIVLIVRSEIEDDVRGHLRRRYGTDEVATLVCQDHHGPRRAKPWGTAHAVLTAAPVVDGPFLVVNADDYYGPSSYRLAAEALIARPDEAVLVGFELARTLPSHGAVSRGVCAVDGSGHLVGLVETHGIARAADGITATDPAGPLDPATTVSMNMWGFPRSVLDELGPRFDAFVGAHAEDPKAELYLPSVVADLQAEGRLAVTVVRSTEDWIGVTNPDDLAVAKATLATRV